MKEHDVVFVKSRNKEGTIISIYRNAYLIELIPFEIITVTPDDIHEIHVP